MRVEASEHTPRMARARLGVSIVATRSESPYRTEIFMRSEGSRLPSRGVRLAEADLSLVALSRVSEARLEAGALGAARILHINARYDVETCADSAEVA